jgi:glycosyltransferase involved in cell wall biosynthesis
VAHTAVRSCVQAILQAVLTAAEPRPASVDTQPHESKRFGLLSQWYEPEPQTLPQVLAHELANRTHSVRVLTGFPNYPLGRLFDGYRMSWRTDEVVSGVPVRRVALFPSHDGSRLGRLTNYGTFAASASLWGTGWFKDIEALWVYNSPPTVGLPTWLIKARYRPRVVLHIMDLWPESLTVSGFGRSMVKSKWLEQFLDMWLSKTYAMADSIACSSRSQIDLLVQRGVSRDKLSYAPLWVDETIFRPVPKDEALLATIGLTGKRVLLYAGALGEAQGLDVLLKACDRVKDAPDFHCVIAGSGIAEERLREEAADRRLPNITFLGRWPTRDMTRLMSIGDVHLVSLRADPLAEVAMPSKLPASLACGKPLIVAARGEAEAVVSRSQSGWTCQPGDPNQLEASIRSAIEATDAELEMLGQNARATYDGEFAVKIGVSRIESLLMRGTSVDGAAR